MKQKSMKSRHGISWSRDDLVLAFDLYCRVSPREINERNPAVEELARILSRTPSAVKSKLLNFVALDPELLEAGIKGLPNVSERDREIWGEFHADWSTLVWEADSLRNKKISGVTADVSQPEVPSGPSEEMRLTKQRVHQAFFREATLSNYQTTCCISGLSIPECLNASHIIPWSEGEEFRANPANGLCLSATFHCLFDAGLLTITEKLTVLFASRIAQHDDPVTRNILESYSGRPINRPIRFLPNKGCLEWHRENIFEE